MNSFSNADSKSILNKMVDAVVSNRDYLCEVDGKIGDGDHGANMAKGFTIFGGKIDDCDSFTDGLDTLGMVLLNEIGGSMGPIYGTIFMGMAEAAEDKDEIDGAVFEEMLKAGLDGLYDIVDARVGDKTLVDTLAPATEAIEKANAESKPFAEALKDMQAAAKAGWQSTENLVAKYGRSARLGERSRGVLDAGSTSCYLILNAIAEGILEIIE